MQKWYAIIGSHHLIFFSWSRRPDDRPSFKEIVFRLDEIIGNLTTFIFAYLSPVDCQLPLEGRQYAEEARHFWKDHYLLPMQALRDPIPWREFVKVLANELKLPISDFAGLQQLLATRIGTDDELSVSLERFGQIVQWFGPFFMASEAPTILAEVRLEERSIEDREASHGFLPCDLQDNYQHIYICLDKFLDNFQLVPWRHIQRCGRKETVPERSR
jgi:hypothetical protein